MAKIENDAYYTPVDVAKRLAEKTLEVIGEENIFDVIEPSAGAGAFSDLFDECESYDIDPKRDYITKADFLTLNLSYRKGRLFIGNPPFGSRNSLSMKFFKKCATLGDFIAFVLPISQLDNNQSLFEFDLLYSEDLGVLKYSGVPLHCCFNIYRRPQSGKLNSKPKYNFEDVFVTEYRRNGTYKPPESYDFAFCSWGNGSLGNPVEYVGQYAQECYITVTNPRMRKRILEVCNSTDWRNLYNSISAKKIQTWKVYKYLQEQIPELK